MRVWSCCLGLMLAACASSTTSASSGSATGAAAIDAAIGADTAAADADPADAGPPPDPLVQGDNVLTVAGIDRHVRVYFPDAPDHAPVVFAWHGSGDSGKNFANALGATKLAVSSGAIIVVPNACSNDSDDPTCPVLPFTWGWKDEAGGMDATLFDDVLARLDATTSIDKDRVYVVGFSAGALETTWLLLHRADKLAGAVTFSGGTGDLLPYVKPSWSIPVMAFSGGAQDQVIISFAETTADLVQHLASDGSFVLACDHGLGHTVPPGGLSAAWKFLQSQTHGVSESPTAATGAKGFPSYCQVVGSK